MPPRRRPPDAAGREIILRNLGGLIAVDFAGRGAPRRREDKGSARRREIQLAAPRTRAEERSDAPSGARRQRRRGDGGQPPAARPEPAPGHDRAGRRSFRRPQAAAGSGGPRGGRRRPARGGEWRPGAPAPRRAPPCWRPSPPLARACWNAGSASRSRWSRTRPGRMAGSPSSKAARRRRVYAGANARPADPSPARRRFLAALCRRRGTGAGCGLARPRGCTYRRC